MGLANSAVTGLSWYTKIATSLSLIFGVIMLIGGICVLTLPDMTDVTRLEASVQTVSWDGEDGCGVTSASNANKRGTSVFHCDVATKYKDDGEEKEYEFHSASGTRYKPGDEIELYKFDNKVSRFNPNGWKNVGWLIILVGAITVLVSLFWLWVCSWNKTLCAIQGGASLLGQAVD